MFDLHPEMLDHHSLAKQATVCYTASPAPLTADAGSRPRAYALATTPPATHLVLSLRDGLRLAPPVA
jgi:hypothetical protein